MLGFLCPISKGKLVQIFENKITVLQTGEMESLMPHISDEEEAQMRRMLQRMDTLAQR